MFTQNLLSIFALLIACILFIFHSDAFTLRHSASRFGSPPVALRRCGRTASATATIQAAIAAKLSTYSCTTQKQSLSASALKMVSYSTKDGVLAQLVEERDACGVGFIASLDNEPRHDILKQALEACTCMEHRGATSADMISGDGAGVMTAVPWNLLSTIMSAAERAETVNADGSEAVAVGMMFLPRDATELQAAVDEIEKIFKRRHFVVKGWREVPTDMSVLGENSQQFVPSIRQVVVHASATSKLQPQSQSLVEFEKRLYDCRREIQGWFRQMEISDTAYTCSLSGKTIVYKGMLRSCDLGAFFTDLRNPEFTTPFAIYHRRFSTNTTPKWYLAQPMRLLAHNGEINTLLGNINWVKSRQYALRHSLQQLQEYMESPHKVRGPLVDVSRSDSANLDSMFENFIRSGYSPEQALMIMVPEAYDSQPRMKRSLQPQLRAFYEYYEALQEAWDGPALLVFSDGDSVGAALDRNGLRPARYMLTADEEDKVTVHMMSEVGVTKSLDQFVSADAVGSPHRIIDVGRLGPGEMMSVNLTEQKLYLNDELKETIAAKFPYPKWVQESIKPLLRKSFASEAESFALNRIHDADNRQLALAAISSSSTEHAPVAVETDSAALIATQTLFGWGTEDVEVQIVAMARDAVEATFSMGDDAPLAALSAMPHTLFDYFKQRFAQVTNPPIDSLREGAVMSLAMFLGSRGDPLSQEGQRSFRVKIDSPVLNAEEMQTLAATDGIAVHTLSTLYPLQQALTQGGLQQQLEQLCEDAKAAVRAGANIINLSDQFEAIAGTTTITTPQQQQGHEQQQLEAMRGSSYIPPLLAVGAVHHALIRAGLRTEASIVVTTAQAWATHHVACLVGYGASAVVPYAAYDAVINWHGQKRNQYAMERGQLPHLTAAQALDNFRKAMDKGLLKILSKMGISLLTSYHGAQIFEALGLDDAVVAAAFTGTACRVTAMSFDDIAAECAEFSRLAFGDELFTGMLDRVESGCSSSSSSEATLKADGAVKKLFNYGFLNYFKSGDYHHNNQLLVKTLHKAIRSKDFDLYSLYEQSVVSRPPTTLRDVLRFVPAEERHQQQPQGQQQGQWQPVALEDVESAESIMRRFVTGGMSLGALSREAHETLSIAMNRIGGKSNSGEGGEDPVRMLPIADVDAATGTSARFPHLKQLRDGDVASSRIKQVASGRFGVTPQYLMAADQLEIKIAQGAKPGEGGQLPGKKIDEYIASLRNSKPGVTLISPPPHHDIYSIEDLAQLIHDLHQVNPAAGVSVKLVSEVGIGTVASGVAKAGADIIQISGHDGGTGASPLTSIRHAGSPWELGLVESHSALLRNGLRERVLLRVDGGLKSGWDVVMAALMGAEEFGFGTIALIAEGCIMARICHTNKCPVGVTTQNVELRKRFPGTPDDIVTYFGYVAEEVRHILARLGYTSLDEIIGRGELLQPRADLQLKKARNVDASFVLQSLQSPSSSSSSEDDSSRSWLRHGDVFSNGRTFDDIILEDPEVLAAIDGQQQLSKSYHISNTDRSSFARVSGVIAQRYGDKKFGGLLRFAVSGGAGQSFGAFLGQGMEVALSGYANDYVGKGMAGGVISVQPPAKDLQQQQQHQHTGTGSRSSSGSNSRRQLSVGRSAAQFSMVGNTVLYGATGGSLFVRGRAGERFAVRNSGAVAVVEGMGEHGCEYMTGGVVLSLGNIGRNFGAGMTGGIAFVLPDEAWMDADSSGSSSDSSGSSEAAVATALSFEEFTNSGTYQLRRLNANNSAARSYLISLLTAHVAATNSTRAAFVLSHLDAALMKLWVAVPPSEAANPILAEGDSAVASALAAAQKAAASSV